MQTKKSYLYSLAIIGVLFFVFGFITWLNGILIPYFQICLELTNFQSLWVAFASFIAYFFMAIPSAWILKYTGYKKGMVLGLVIMAIGTILFIPAAYSRTYIIFLIGLFITGAGLALLQTAANPYIAIIGPIESTAQRTSFMGIANKVAGIVSQRVLGVIFLFNADAIIANTSNAANEKKNLILDSYALKVINPYIIITAILILLAFLVFYSRLPEVDDQENRDVDEKSTRSAITQYPYLILGIITLFFSEGCEVIAIDGIILYGRSLGISIDTARFFTEYTLYAMLAGYLLGIMLIPKYLKQHTALQISSAWSIIMVIGSYFSSGIISVYFMAFMGLGTALFWGTIWGLSIRNLGKFTKFGAALLIMAVSGGAVIPLIFGWLIDINPSHPQNAVLLLLPCLLVLFFFSTWGYKIQRWKKDKSKLQTHTI
jgi:glucose/galactose transporter